MSPSRLFGAAAACIALGLGAQTYPDRPVRILVGSTPGGTPDVIARTVGDKLAELLGQQFVAENRPGAGAYIAAEATAKAAPDGYTLMAAVSPPLATIPAMVRNATIDPVTSFTPIAAVATQDFVLTVTAAFPARTLGELVAHAQANPGKVSYASAGNGTPHHLGMELFKQAAGIDLVHVPYRGAPAAVPDLIAGQVPVAFMSYVIAAPHIGSGKLRALGVTSAKRFTQAPDIPTFAEAGMPNFNLSGWIGFIAPAKTPPEVVGKLDNAIRSALEDAAVRKRFDALGLAPWHVGHERFTHIVREDVATWSRVIREANIRPE